MRKGLGDGETPHSIDELHARATGVSQEWEQDGFFTESEELSDIRGLVGSNAATESYYVDERGELIIVGYRRLDEAYERSRQLDDWPRPGAAVDVRFLVNGEIIDITTPYLGHEWPTNIDQSLNELNVTGMARAHIYDVSGIDPSELSPAMQRLVAIFGTQLDETIDFTGGHMSNAADDKTGVNQRYTFREPYPLSRKLGDVGYALEYAEQVVEIKKGEYAAAEDEALSRWYAERANAAMAGVKKGKFTTGARYDELRQQAYNDQIAKDMAVRQGQQ